MLGLRRLDEKLEKCGLPHTHAFQRGGRQYQILGFLIAFAWHIVPPHPVQPLSASSYKDLDDCHLMHSIYYGGTASQRPKAIIEFPFVAAARLSTPVPLPDTELLQGQEPLESFVFAASVWRVLNEGVGQEVQEHVGGTWETKSLVQLLQEWMRHWHMPMPSSQVPPFVGWRMWSPLAALAVRGQWPSDMAAVFQRRVQGMHYARLRHDHPPQKLLQQHIDLKASGYS